MISSSATVAGRTSRSRWVVDAPRMRHGLVVVKSSAIALLKIALSRA